MILFGVCLGMPLGRMDSALQCETPIFTWLIVQAGLYFSVVLKNFLIIFVVTRTHQNKRNTSIIELTYACIVGNFQIAWLIYGNTFHYSREGLLCRDLNSETHSLWILSMIIIAVGYLYFAAYGCIICALSCVICCVALVRNDEGGSWGLQH